MLKYKREGTCTVSLHLSQLDSSDAEKPVGKTFLHFVTPCWESAEKHLAIYLNKKTKGLTFFMLCLNVCCFVNPSKKLEFLCEVPIISKSLTVNMLLCNLLKALQTDYFLFFLLCWDNMSEWDQQNNPQLFLGLLCHISQEQQFVGVVSCPPSLRLWLFIYSWWHLANFVLFNTAPCNCSDPLVIHTHLVFLLLDYRLYSALLSEQHRQK